MNERLPIERIFYVNVKNMPRSKAEEYIKAFADQIEKLPVFHDTIVAAEYTKIEFFDPNPVLLDWAKVIKD